MLAPRGLGNALQRSLRLASPIRPQGAERGAARAAALCSQHGQSARRAVARSARPRRADAALSLAAAAGPGSHAQGRQAAPLSPTWHASAAPDCPEAAPCAGVAWAAGAPARVGSGGQSRQQSAACHGSAGAASRWRAPRLVLACQPAGVTLQ